MISVILKLVLKGYVIVLNAYYNYNKVENTMEVCVIIWGLKLF